MGQLAQNAATNYARVTPANGTRNSLAYSGPPTNDAVDHASLGYTNTTFPPAAEEVEVFGSMTWWVPNSSNTWRVGPAFRGTNGATSINDASVIGSSAVTQPTPFVFARSFTVQPGDTIYMNLSSSFSTASGSGSTGTTFQWADMALKYNVIKR
jgi:hypothetical protein